MLIITTFSSLEDEGLHEALRDKGFPKFILREVDLDDVERRYQGRYRKFRAELDDVNEVRVLDANGRQVFVSFEIPSMGKMIEVEDEIELP